MEEVFRHSKFEIVFSYFAILICFTLSFSAYVNFGDWEKFLVSLFLTVPGVLISLISIYRKVVVNQTYIRYSGLFVTRQISIKNIEGYSENNYCVFFVTRNEEKEMIGLEKRLRNSRGNSFWIFTLSKFELIEEN